MPTATATTPVGTASEQQQHSCGGMGMDGGCGSGGQVDIVEEGGIGTTTTTTTGTIRKKKSCPTCNRPLAKVDTWRGVLTAVACFPCGIYYCLRRRNLRCKTCKFEIFFTKQQHLPATAKAFKCYPDMRWQLFTTTCGSGCLSPPLAITQHPYHHPSSTTVETNFTPFTVAAADSTIETTQDGVEEGDETTRSSSRLELLDVGQLVRQMGQLDLGGGGGGGGRDSEDEWGQCSSSQCSTRPLLPLAVSSPAPVKIPVLGGGNGSGRDGGKKKNGKDMVVAGARGMMPNGHTP